MPITFAAKKKQKFSGKQPTKIRPSLDLKTTSQALAKMSLVSLGWKELPEDLEGFVRNFQAALTAVKEVGAKPSRTISELAWLSLARVIAAKPELVKSIGLKDLKKYLKELNNLPVRSYDDEVMNKVFDARLAIRQQMALLKSGDSKEGSSQPIREFSANNHLP